MTDIAQVFICNNLHGFLVCFWRAKGNWLAMEIEGLQTRYIFKVILHPVHHSDGQLNKPLKPDGVIIGSELQQQHWFESLAGSCQNRWPLHPLVRVWPNFFLEVNDVVVHLHVYQKQDIQKPGMEMRQKVLEWPEWQDHLDFMWFWPTQWPFLWVKRGCKIF